MAFSAKLVYGKPVMVKRSTGTSWSAGDVIIDGAVPFVAHEDNPSFTGGTLVDAVACEGGIYECNTDGTPVKGEDVFWDATNKKLTATSAGNTHFGTCLTGPTFDANDAGPASDGDHCLALHNPRGRTPAGDNGKAAENTVSTTGNLTAAQVLAGFVNSAPTGAITLTLPTAALLVAGMAGCKVGDQITLAIENTSAGANAITLAAGTGGTLRGGTSIAQNKAALVKIVLTNVTASSEAYTAYAIIGA